MRQREKLIVDFLRHIGHLDIETRTNPDPVENAEPVFRFPKHRGADGKDLFHTVVREQAPIALQNTAKFAEGRERKPSAAEHLFAESRCLAHALDDFNILHRGEGNDDEARMYGADMNDAVKKSLFHDRLPPFFLLPWDMSGNTLKTAISFYFNMKAPDGVPEYFTKDALVIGGHKTIKRGGI